MDLGNPGTAFGPLGLFCARLRRLQTTSGIKQAGLLNAAGLKKTQVSDILNGKIERPPDWGVTIAMVRACLEHAKAAGRLVPPDLSDEADWQRRYFDLEQDLDTAERARPRREEQTGRLLDELTDPFEVEIHRPVEPDAPQPGLPVLPAYVARDHDTTLGQVVTAAVEGRSGVAVLVGGSSTGKTRACWEALRLLRDQLKPWRLWHPIDPSRPEAALRELPAIGPRTVVWLNEAQFYLDGAGGLGERIAAGLREVMRDPGRAPVLVLATLWPQHWDALTARPAAGADPHAQARELLAGRDITVPAAFTAGQLRLLPAMGDQRLALAAEAAEDGRVVQFLAGAPELMARYRNAQPAAAALISAAMDARRLGMGVALPLAFLEAAAPGYLTDTDWDGLGEDWLEQALAYTTAPSKGIRGLLSLIRPRAVGTPVKPPEQVYRLADYLEQQGRHDRSRHIPSAAFWTAAVHFATASDLPPLAKAAEARGLLRDAARLRKSAIAQGDSGEAVTLVRHWRSLPSPTADSRLAQWAAAHVALCKPGYIGTLLADLWYAGAKQQAAALISRDPAGQAALNDPLGVTLLLQALRVAGAGQQVAALIARDPAAHAALDNREHVLELMEALRGASAGQQVAALIDRAAAHVTRVNHPDGFAWLLWHLARSGSKQQAAALAARAAAHADLDDPFGVAWLLQALREADAGQQVAALIARNPAAHVDLDNPGGVAWLLHSLREAGAEQQVAALIDRDPAAHVALDDTGGVAELLGRLQRAGAKQQASTLIARIAVHDSEGVARLLHALREAGAGQQVAALIARDPAAHVDLDNPGSVARLLHALREAGAGQQVAALIARDPAAQAALCNPRGVEWLLFSLLGAGAKQQAVTLADRIAAHAALDNPGDVAWLLDSLRKAGAERQAAALIARDPAAHVALHDMGGVSGLLDSLREAGAEHQVATLVDRLPAEGQFEIFRAQPGHKKRYRFGREPNGSPAPSWDWDDLD